MTTPTFAKTHNLIDYLVKPAKSEGFEQIIDFLNESSVRYALIASLTIRTSCIKQFWSTAKVKTVNDEVRVQALIDAKRYYGISNDLFATDQKFNFSRYILLSLVKNIEAGVPFYMFPRFVQLIVDHQLGDMSHHQGIYDNPSLTKKVFSNMKRVGTGFFGVITPLFENVLVSAAEEVEHTIPSPSNDPILDADKDSLKFQELIDLCTRLSNKVLDLKTEVINIKSYFTDKIKKLKNRVHKLKEENMILKEKSFKSAKIDTTALVEDKEESFKQGRMIADMDEDVESAKIDTAAPVEDKEKSFKQGRMIADMDEDVEVNLKEAQAKAYNLDLQHSEKVLNMQDIDEEEPVKNMAGFKMNFFKGMTYSEIRPLFEKHYNLNIAFLKKVEEEVTIQEKDIEEEGNKRKGKCLEQEIAKKQMMDEKEEELKRHLQIVSNDDDDVYTEATPLASKNFDREDLETLWKLVKERLKVKKESEMSLELLRLVRRQLNEGYVPE
nr:hypothetical protein [Tanacetum cinerariifolium]